MPLTGTYTSSFSGTENPLSEAGLWVAVGAVDRPKKTSGLVTARTANIPARSSYVGNFGSEQSSEIRIDSLSASGIVGVMTRIESGHCYFALWTIADGFLYLDREDTPSSIDQIAGPIAGPAFSTGALFRLRSRSGLHTVSIDGTDYIAVTDNTYTNGSPGIYVYYLSDPAEAGLGAWASTTIRYSMA